MTKVIVRSILFSSLVFVTLTANTKTDPDRVKIAFGGDTLFGGYYASPVYGSMVLMTDQIDSIITVGGIDSVVHHFFRNINPIINLADYSILNLEGPITYPLSTDDIDTAFTLKKVPLRQHENTADILQAAGIDLVSLANNHSFDFLGNEGLQMTIDCLSDKVEFVGAGIGADAYNGITKTFGGITITFFSVTDVVDQASLDIGKDELGVAIIPGTSHYDNNRWLQILLNKITDSQKFSDFVVVLLHAGPVSGSTVSSRQISICEILIKHEVDVIVGAGSHEKQEIREFKNEAGNLHQLIFYGLGNFIFGARKYPQATGMIALIEFVKTNGKKHLNYETYDIAPNPDSTFVPQVK